MVWLLSLDTSDGNPGPNCSPKRSRLRKKTTAELQSLGYTVSPSDANFFMVNVRRQIQPVIEEFRKRNVDVGRPFPPLLEDMRVSIGTEDEMNRFIAAFKDIFVSGKTSQPGPNVG